MYQYRFEDIYHFFEKYFYRHENAGKRIMKLQGTQLLVVGLQRMRSSIISLFYSHTCYVYLRMNLFETVEFYLSKRSLAFVTYATSLFEKCII